MDFSKDFTLCDDAFLRVVAHFGEPLRVNRLPEALRTVVLVWHATGIIGNGGFKYLFEADFPGDPDFGLTLAAFEAIGCQPAADALREALSLFPKGIPHMDLALRDEFYLSVNEDRREALHGRFWSCSTGDDPQIKKLLADYIRARSEQLTKIAS